MGANRVEIEGPADGEVATLKRMGCISEIVSWRTRVFAPGAEVLERWPFADLDVAPDATQDDPLSGVAHAASPAVN